jgi:hypothetical protein
VQGKKVCYTVRVKSTFRSLLWLTILVPVSAFAQQRTLQVTNGSGFDIWDLFGRLISYLAGAIFFISPVIFLIGALMYTASGVQEGLRQRGKDAMIYSIVGFFVVLSSYAILRSVYYVLR